MKYTQKVLMVLIMTLLTNGLSLAITKQDEIKLKASIETLLKKDVTAMAETDFKVWKDAVSGQIQALKRDRKPQAEIYEGMLAQKLQEYTIAGPKIAQLEFDLKKATEKWKKAQDHVKNTKKELVATEKQLVIAIQTALDFLKQLIAQENEIAQLKLDVTNAYNKGLSLINGLNSAKNKLVAEITNLEKLKEQHDVILEQLALKIKALEGANKEEKNKLNEEIEKLKNNEKFLITLITAGQENVNKTKDTLNKLNKDLQINQSDLEKKEKELKEAQQKEFALQKKLKEAEDNAKKVLGQKEQQEKDSIATIADLKDQLEKQKQELEKKIKEETKGKQDRELLQKQLDQITNELSVVKKESETTITELKKNLEQEKVGFTILKESWDIIARKYMENRADLKKLSKDKEGKEKEYLQKLNELENAYTQKNNQAIVQKEKELEQKNAELFDISKKLNTKEIENENLGKKIMLKEKELEESKATYLSTLQDLTNAKIKLETDYKDLEKTYADQEKTLDNAREEIKQLKSSYEEEIANFKEEQKVLEELIATNESTISKFKELVKQKDALVKEKTLGIVSLQSAIELQKNRISTEKGNKEVLEKELANLRKNYEDAQQEVRASTKTMEQATTIISQLQNQIQENKTRINKKSTKLNQEREKMLQFQKEYEQYLEKMTQKTAAVIDEFKKQLETNKNLSNQEINDLKNATDKLKNDNASKEKEIEKLKQDIKSLEEKRAQDIKEIKESLSKDINNETPVKLAKMTFFELNPWALKIKGLIERLDDNDNDKISITSKFNNLFRDAISKKQNETFDSLKAITFDKQTFSSKGWKESFNTFHDYYRKLTVLTENIMQSLAIINDANLINATKKLIKDKQRSLVTMQLIFINEALTYYYQSNLDMTQKDTWSVQIEKEKPSSKGFDEFINALKSNKLVLNQALSGQLDNRKKLARTALDTISSMASSMNKMLINMNISNQQYGLGEVDLKGESVLKTFKDLIKQYMIFFDTKSKAIESVDKAKNAEIYNQLMNIFDKKSTSEIQFLENSANDLINSVQQEY